MNLLRRAAYYWTLAWSFISLLAERLWARLWAFSTVIMFFGALAAAGLVFKAGKTGHAVILALFVLFALFTLLFTGRRFRLPRRAHVERRIERESGLKHRPLAMIHDRPEPGTPDAAAKLWYAEQAAVAKLFTRLKIWRPRPRVYKQDKYGLRFAAMACLAVSLVIAQGKALDRIKAALTPPPVFQLPQTQIAMDVWIEPPEYTHAAPVFLATAQTGRNADAEARVPAGSLLKLRVAGPKKAPHLRYNDQKIGTFAEAGPKSFTFEMPLTESGTMEIRRGWWQSPLGSWDVEIIPDGPAELKILSVDAAERAALKITYTARDDYGVQGLKAVIAPSPDVPDEPWHETIILDLPFSGKETREAEQHIVDLAEHTMAGVPVTISLTATDEAGNHAESNIEYTVLPERQFKNPSAILINNERKRLIRFSDPLTYRITAPRLASLANRPALIKEDMRVFLGLVVVIKRLIYSPHDDQIPGIRSLLWHLALRLEDGGLQLAKQELRDALQRLKQALNDKNISEEKLQELNDDVNRKTQQYMQELAKEMKQRMQQQGGDQKQPEISPELAQKLMEKMDMSEMKELMEQMQHGDSREQMQAMTEYMQKMLDALDPDNAMGQQDQKKLENLQKMEDLIRDQQQLMDKTGKMEPRQEAGEEAGEQGRIRKELGDVMREMGENMPEVPEQFGDADQEMRKSQQQLGGGKPDESLPHQKKALDKLQEGQEEAMQQFADQMKQMIMMGSGGKGNDTGNYGEGFDPLGREGNKNINRSDVKIPDEKERRRVQEIIQELRGRSNDWQRPREERQYIDRLLDPYSN